MFHSLFHNGREYFNHKCCWGRNEITLADCFEVLKKSQQWSLMPWRQGGPARGLKLNVMTVKNVIFIYINQTWVWGGFTSSLSEFLTLFYYFLPQTLQVWEKSSISLLWSDGWLCWTLGHAQVGSTREKSRIQAAEKEWSKKMDWFLPPELSHGCSWADWKTSWYKMTFAE